MADLFWNGIPRAARRLRLQLPRPIQLRFLYDRGIPIWAGPVIGWLLQRSGGIAIHRGRLDRPALAQARGALAQGRYPLVVAPGRSHQQPVRRDGALGAGGGPAGVLGR